MRWRKCNEKSSSEVASVELDGCRPVEVVERDTFFEAGLEESSFELLGIAALTSSARMSVRRRHSRAAGHARVSLSGRVGIAWAELEPLEEGDK
ncbi:MAG: hypothetical protein R3B97_11790 [Dehalococcoidia bacterium]